MNDMHDPLHEHRPELTHLCRQFHVKTLELFGSATQETYDPVCSDLDFLVDFLPLEPGPHAKAYFGLWFALKQLFGCEVDLVETPALRNPYFLKTIAPQRQVLYAV
jgi:predicted nucleotidyltransferase